MLAEAVQFQLSAVDWSRRMAGTFLDTFGFAPARCPSSVVLDRSGFVLRDYARDRTAAPAVLIVPAPIKRPYIWDLAPDRSVVQAALAHGWRVYILDWKRPGRQQGDWGLAQYADEFPAQAVRAVLDQTGHRPVIVFGHSLGGTLAGIYASLHPAGIAAMVLLESPLYFRARDDAFAPLVTASPPCEIGRVMGAVPGTFLDVASAVAAPEVFHWFRVADLFASLHDAEKLATNQQVERWSLDEAPMAGKLFDEIVELLYRANSFMEGRLSLNGRFALPMNIMSPALCVYNPHSRLITAAMIRRFHAVLSTPQSILVPYEGEIGVALEHVGPLVGERAHRELWPRIFQWMQQFR